MPVRRMIALRSFRCSEKRFPVELCLRYRCRKIPRFGLKGYNRPWTFLWLLQFATIIDLYPRLYLVSSHKGNINPPPSKPNHPIPINRSPRYTTWLSQEARRPTGGSSTSSPARQGRTLLLPSLKTVKNSEFLTSQASIRSTDSIVEIILRLLRQRYLAQCLQGVKRKLGS